MPWDPAALWMLAGKHQREYQALQAAAQAAERRLFTADQPAPASRLGPGRTLLQVRSLSPGWSTRECCAWRQLFICLLAVPAL